MVNYAFPRDQGDREELCSAGNRNHFNSSLFLWPVPNCVTGLKSSDLRLRSENKHIGLIPQPFSK